MPPWTPTRELRKRNFLPRRMGYMIKTLEQEAYEKALQDKSYPEFKPGDVVEVKLALPENQRRTIPVRGIVIAIRNRGIRTSFTILNNIPGGGNIERTFPLFCPTIQELRVVQKQRIKARRAKLYYLCDRKPSEFKV
ncbi:hypothetical protein WJX81_006800 [Elliptochloris bilobata]|uniref:50S ribosomal protein L19 n=1 Tax=Elliptochloris bilobata TaxID=381761 RepID=A0AAW1QLG1_9CHLO